VRPKPRQSPHRLIKQGPSLGVRAPGTPRRNSGRTNRRLPLAPAQAARGSPQRWVPPATLYQSGQGRRFPWPSRFRLPPAWPGPGGRAKRAEQGATNRGGEQRPLAQGHWPEGSRDKPPQKRSAGAEGCLVPPHCQGDLRGPPHGGGAVGRRSKQDAPGRWRRSADRQTSAWGWRSWRNHLPQAPGPGRRWPRRMLGSALAVQGDPPAC